MRWLVRSTMTMALLICSCIPVDEQPPDLLVFAAASLTNAFNDISKEFERSSGLTIINAYGASQMLAQQIANGAPADVFISAGEFPIDFLSNRGLLVSDATEIINNTLVIVVRDKYKIESESIDDLMIELSGEFAIADPALSPAGMYAKEFMINL